MPQSATICVYVGLDLVGDGLMKLPFLRALRHAYPTAHVTWLAGKGRSAFAHELAPLVRGLVDEVIEAAGIGSNWRELLKRPLSGRRFDVVIDTQRRLLTTLIVKRIDHTIFISGAANFFFSTLHPDMPYRKPASMVRQMLDLIEALNGDKPQPDAPLSIDPEIEQAAARLLPPGRRYIGLAPGAGGKHKCWPLANYLALGRWLAETGSVPVFLLGPAESEWIDACRAVPGAKLPLQDAASHDPVLTIALARRLRAAVANDSGAGHMLAAGDVKLVSLFGPTAPEKFAPLTPRLVVLRAQGFGGEAMEKIPIDAVKKAVEELLA